MNEKAVVVGIKEKQPTALRFAAEAAIARGARLRVIHCLDVRVAGDFVSVPHDSWQAAGESILEDARELVNELDPSLPADYLADVWSPFKALRDAAKSASMLVLGVDSAASFGPLFGGSVTERLITHAPVPVAVVPERAWPEETLAGPIFVAIDASTPARGALRFAFAEADRTTRELHVAHVIPEADMFYKSMAHKVDVSEVLAGWSEEFPDVHVTHRFFFDDAGDGCLRVSEEASLLVLGRRATHICGHPVLTEIAKRTHCPCVVVPDNWKAH